MLKNLPYILLNMHSDKNSLYFIQFFYDPTSDRYEEVCLTEKP